MAVLLSTSLLPSASPTLTVKLSTKLIIKANHSSSHHPFSGLTKKDRVKESYVCLSVDGSQSTIQRTNRGKNPRKGNWKPLLSEGRDEDENYGPICPGCGVFMQDEDPNLPGFYQKKKVEVIEMLDDEEGLEEEDFGDENDVEEEDFGDEIEGKFDENDVEEEGFGDEIKGELEEIDLEDGNVENKNGIDWDSEEWDSDFDDEDDDSKEFDGFAAPSAGYGNITEETIEKGKRKRLSKAERKQIAREALKEREEVTVCARCHSLRNYGQVKNQTAENLIPDFDFNRLITTRLMKPAGTADSVVVVMVVDCVDFDGSFPKRAAKSLFKALEGIKDGSNLSKKLPKLVLVATKADLLPSQISPTRLDRWVRHRAKALGAPKLRGVYLVSSRKDLGVRNLLAFIKELAGPRGNVWVIGAQNAGKSTLINAFAKKQGVKVSKLTEAAIPGTTLGILRIGGVLPAKAKMYDTPGLLHPYLMSMRLNRDEQKMIEIRKELRPRSYRIKASSLLPLVYHIEVLLLFQFAEMFDFRCYTALLPVVLFQVFMHSGNLRFGQSIHIGGLVRLDLNKASVETIYVTIWASPSVSLHLGKTENADEIWSKHAGVRLQPPIGIDRVSEMGEWIEKEVKVSGTSWDVNSIDIAVAGLGWASLGLKGEATLTLFTFDGIEVILREPLVLDRAQFLERPGFWLPKGVSEAIGNQIKVDARTKERLEEEDSFLTEVSA
ncbi:hypothetical protein LguiB_004280 [Lonicera macranthoides]